VACTVWKDTALCVDTIFSLVIATNGGGNDGKGKGSQPGHGDFSAASHEWNQFWLPNLLLASCFAGEGCRLASVE